MVNGPIDEAAELSLHSVGSVPNNLAKRTGATTPSFSTFSTYRKANINRKTRDKIKDLPEF